MDEERWGRGRARGPAGLQEAGRGVGPAGEPARALPPRKGEVRSQGDSEPWQVRGRYLVDRRNESLDPRESGNPYDAMDATERRQDAAPAQDDAMAQSIGAGSTED